MAASVETKSIVARSLSEKQKATDDGMAMHSIIRLAQVDILPPLYWQHFEKVP